MCLVLMLLLCVCCDVVLVNVDGVVCGWMDVDGDVV